MPDFDITSLETQGFLVVKNLLNTADIDRLLADYKQQRNHAGDVVQIKDRTLLKSGTHGLEDKIIPLINLIAQHTDIQLDLIGPTGTYFDTSLANLGWHQDHESYYYWQTGYHQVNFWIPLVKPHAELSGLKVVPMHTLKSHIGSLFDQRILGQGAKRFVPDGNVTHVIDDECGDKFDLSVNIDAIAQAPAMQPGDVLIVRGDVIHATQDAASHRVTLAVRTVDGNRYVNKQQFQSQCDFKKFVLGANAHSTKKMNDQFSTANDQVLIHDLFKGRIQKEK